MNNHVYIIAEAGVNHNGSLEMAKELIKVAADAGADAVKFQTFRAEKLVGKNAEKAEYQQKTTSMQETQYQMLKKLELTEAMHETLVGYCQTYGIEFLSTPFDEDSLHMLVQKYDIACIKIPSGEITNAPFLLKIAQTGKPVILSTGMSTLADIEAALQVLAFGYLKNGENPSLDAFEGAYLSKAGQELLKEKVKLLHCTTEYPAPLHEVNLRVLETLHHAFGLDVGYSDHTQGIAVPIAAVARGATIIEKHFTVDRNLPGPDHQASLEPDELKNMIVSIRQVEIALGESLKLPTRAECKNKKVARKSLVAIKPITAGEVFTKENLGVKRPGDGISPACYWQWLGKSAERSYHEDEKILR